MNRASFSYRNDVFCAETIPLPELAETIETPFLCTSAHQILRNARDMSSPFVGRDCRIDYVVGAKPNVPLLRAIENCKIGGASVANAGELERALEADFKPDQISLCGACYTTDDLLAAFLAKVRAVRVENFVDLRLAGNIAQTLSRAAPVCLALDLGFGEKQAVASSGFPVEQLASALDEVLSCPSLSFQGLSLASEAFLHDADLLVKAYGRLREIIALLRGQGIDVPHLDFGLAPPDVFGNVPFSAQAELICQMMGALGCSFSFQAGRRLIGNATLLVSRIRQVRQKNGQACLVLDALPASLSGSYEIVPLYQTSAPVRETAVMGLYGGEERMFGEGFALPGLEEGDLVALLPAGLEGGERVPAAGMLTAPTEVLVSGARSAIIRRRMAVAEQMAWEQVPEWMGDVDAA